LNKTQKQLGGTREAAGDPEQGTEYWGRRRQEKEEKKGEKESKTTSIGDRAR